MTQSRSYSLIALGAALWGCVGIFVNGLSAQGLSSIQIAWLRMAGGAVIMIVWMLRRSPRALRLQRWSDVRFFVLTGAVSIAVFQWSYISAIGTIGISAAVVLLYTSPGFVVLFSRLFFGEPITPLKVASLLAMITGVVAVSGGFGGQALDAGVGGILIGLTAGISFSLYSVVGKRALIRYGAQTVTVYTFAIATLSLTPAAVLTVAPVVWLAPGVIGWGIGIVALPTVAAYLCYTVGLKGVESGRAAIVSSLEVLVATFVGVVVFSEAVGVAQLTGTALVLAAALAIQHSR